MIKTLPEKNNYESQIESYLVDADHIAGINYARHKAGEEAAAILAGNRASLMAGQIDYVPYDVDPLGTAKAVMSGAPMEALVDDCERLFAEAENKGRAAYFQPFKETYLDGDLYFNSQSLIKLHSNALSPICHPEESVNRHHEYVENTTYVALIESGRFVGQRVLTIGLCPEYAIEAFEQSKKSKASARQKDSFNVAGYNPESRQYVIRQATIEKDGVVIEQASLPGLLHDPEVIKLALNSLGAELTDEMSSAANLRSRQFVGDIELFDIIKAADEIASQKYETQVFMGMVAVGPVDYENVKTESSDRVAGQRQRAKEAAEFLLDLARKNLDPARAAYELNHYCKKILLRDFKDDNEKLAVIFDQSTAQLVARLTQLEREGSHSKSHELADFILAIAPVIAFCGNGSCDLEFVRTFSEEEITIRQMGIDGPLLLDLSPDRVCKKCQSPRIVYATEESKVICVDCKAEATY